MATLALILAFGLGGWLLARDCIRRTTLGWALWIPTILVMALGSRSPSEWLAIGSAWQESNSGNALDHVFFLGLTIGAVLVLISRRMRWSKLCALNFVLLLFYLYFAVSISWADNGDASFRRWFKDAGFLFVAVLILSEKDPLTAMRAVYIRAACVLLPLSVVCCRYYPQVSRSFAIDGTQELSGVAIDKNHLGESVMVMGLFLCWDYLETRSKGAPRRWNWDALILALLGSWLLWISNSKTAFACMLIGLTLLLFRRGRLASSKIIGRSLLLGALSLPFLVLLTQEFRTTLGPVLAMLGRDATFTGRTAIWEHITFETVDPITGAGFWNFWGEKRGLAIIRAMNTPIPEAHNGYLDIYLDGGFIGLGLLFLLLLRGGNRFMQGQRSALRFRYALLIVVIVYNLAESLFARPSVLWFTTLLILIDVPERNLLRAFPNYLARWRPELLGPQLRLHGVSQPGD
jgi:O-antigen ligase